MVNKSRETNYVIYAIVGIVAIVAVVGLISILDDEQTEVMDMDELVLLTASFIYQEKAAGDCFSIAERPCYMRGTKAPIYWVQVGESGAENAYNKCLLNPNLIGEFLFQAPTAVCNKGERVHFCYQGHGFALYYLNGECL